MIYFICLVSKTAGNCVHFRDMQVYCTTFLTTLVDPSTLSGRYNLVLTRLVLIIRGLLNKTLGCGENTLFVSSFIFNKEKFWFTIFPRCFKIEGGNKWYTSNSFSCFYPSLQNLTFLLSFSTKISFEICNTWNHSLQNIFYSFVKFGWKQLSA